jgi:hypothetical protein
MKYCSSTLLTSMSTKMVIEINPTKMLIRKERERESKVISENVGSNCFLH